MGAPWYTDAAAWSERADGLVAAARELPPAAPAQAELRSYAAFAAAKVIFESNQIEGVGLSDGETRRVLDQYFPGMESPTTRARLSTSVVAISKKATEISRALEALGIPPASLEPRVKFEGQSKKVREVTQHYSAYRHCMAIAAEYHQRMGDYAIARLVLDDPGCGAVVRGWFEDKPEVQDRLRLAYAAAHGEALSEEDLGEEPTIDWVEAAKTTHAVLGDGLLPEDAGVRAGEFRIDARSVGTELAFPAPELLGPAMSEWANTARDLVWRGPLSIAVPSSGLGAAARISYDFVRIHPFPDGNGRVSRLLMNMVLAMWGLPFPVALRGTKQGRQRYKQSLRRADRGELDRYECLIARAVVGGFDDVNANLATAGIAPLEPLGR
jgi:hypothetical protein